MEELRLSKLKGISKFDKDVSAHWTGEYRYYGLFFGDYLNYTYSNVCTYKDSSLSFYDNKIYIYDGFTDIEISTNLKKKFSIIYKYILMFKYTNINNNKSLFTILYKCT